MLNQEPPQMDPISLFARATEDAGVVIAAVDADQLGRPTPCAEWTVQVLIDHMVGSTRYLLEATGSALPVPSGRSTAAAYRLGRTAALKALAVPGALDQTCASPLGFDWTVAQATMGAFMDTLVHTWDLAVAIGHDPNLDDELVEACIEAFLPDMPEQGRAAGLVGPAIAVGHDAGPQARLLGAMGRRPEPATAGEGTGTRP
jgi:uncharacterized protein (TIGR03086 family)